jgi:hypothetical protein
MFLEYGVDAHDELIHISQVARGHVTLTCPYCGAPLVARKGKRVAHHFAHVNETCREARRDFAGLNVPLFDRFDTHLSPKVWSALQRYAKNTETRTDRQLLLDAGVLDPNLSLDRTRLGYTLKGAVPLGLAAPNAFSEFQLQLVVERHRELSNAVKDAYFGRSYRGTPSGMSTALYPEQARIALIDLKLYRAQVRRIYSKDLYLLHLRHSVGTLYKIGVSGRDIAERIEEIRRDVQPFFALQEIKALQVCRSRGAVEHYLHYRYREQRVVVGDFVEYFNLDDNWKTILQDYSRLGDLQPPALLKGMLENRLSSIEVEILRSQQQSLKRRQD